MVADYSTYFNSSADKGKAAPAFLPLAKVLALGKIVDISAKSKAKLVQNP